MSAEHAHEDHGHEEAAATPAEPAKPAAEPAAKPAAGGAKHSAEPAKGRSAAAPADAATHAPASGERPITRGYNKVKSALTSSASNVVNSTSAFGNWLRKVFRAGELKPIERVSIPKTPVYTAGHIIDGTALCLPRRAIEIGEPVAAAALAAGKTMAIPFRPIYAFMHPIETIKKPVRFATSALMLGKNSIMAIPRTVSEVAGRAIHRTVEQIRTQLERIPAIKSILAKPAAWISRKVSDIISSVKNGVDYTTSFMDHIHNATATGGAAPVAHAAAAHGH